MRRLILILFALPALAGSPIWEIGNRFAEEHGKWVKLRNARQDSTYSIDAAEMIQWQRVKSSWRTLERSMDAEYRGER